MEAANDKRKAVIFDIGNVVLDWNPRYLYRKLLSDEQAVEQFLNKIGFFEWNLEQDWGRSYREGMALLCQKFPEDQALIRAYDERWGESVAGPIQGTVDLIQTLKQAGYPLYGLSNWNQEKFRLTRGRYAFFDWFDDIVVSGEVKLAKPDPRIYQLLLARIDRPADECIFIDDSATNTAVARELGFTAIHFESPAQLENEFRRMNLIR